LENLKGMDHFEVMGVNDGRIALEWILEKYGGNVWTGLIWVRIGNSGGFLLPR
jgi:hypothetical protein